MYMAKGLDTGDIISQAEIEIGLHNTETLTAALSELGAELVCKTMSDIESGKAERKVQDDSQSTYCGKLTKDIVVNDIEDVYDIDINDVDAVVQWNPLDTFAGTFDGNGHTISGLVRNVAQETDPQDVGFIRVLVANPETPTVIRNLGLVKSMFYAKNSDVAMGIFAVRVVDSDLEDGADSYAQIVNCFNQSVAYFEKMVNVLTWCAMPIDMLY
jgi:hypothetical protein